MAGGAPLGNKNGVKARIWSDAVKRALDRMSTNGKEGVKMIDEAADALVAKAVSGDVAALKELGDRIEGKAIQPVANTDGDGNTIPIAVAIQFVAKGSE